MNDTVRRHNAREAQVSDYRSVESVRCLICPSKPTKMSQRRSKEARQSVRPPEAVPIIDETCVQSGARSGDILGISPFEDVIPPALRIRNSPSQASLTTDGRCPFKKNPENPTLPLS